MFGRLRKLRRRKARALRALPLDAALFDGPAPPLYGALAEHWAAEDPDFATAPDARVQIERIERRYALRIPEDFRDYLLLASPRKAYWDFQGTQWWAPSEIKNLADECPDWPPDSPQIDGERDKYLVFADFLIWCYAWAICCSDGPNRGKVALIRGARDGFVADSFRAFLRMELTDDLWIHSRVGD